MEKTIKEWLEGLEEPYRGQALENLRISDEKDGIITSDCILESVTDAVLKAFIWEDSNEGYRYWCDLFEKLEKQRNCLRLN